MASLAHPGGTVTGMDTAAPCCGARRVHPAGVYCDAEWREAETAAGALGLTIPQSILLRADEVIQ